MPNNKILFVSLFVTLSVAFASSSLCSAEEGQPIAIRHWPGGGFTVESMWNLHVGVGLNEDSKAKLPRPVDAELERLPGPAGAMVSLYREANEAEVQLTKEHQHSKENGVELCISEVLVDGLSLAFMDHDRMENRLEKMAQDDRRDLVIVAIGEQFTSEFCQNVAEAHQPVLMVVNSSITEVGDAEVETIAHNTVVVSRLKAKSKTTPKTTRFVSLGTTPYQMSDELKTLFTKKEAACSASREMFSKLSVEQMNFKPANGTHTPRWNSEHMMGRELLFFSQIYHAVDPSIPVMNLNPKQMPPDYEFAHPDWTGEEEARQMKRVEDFTRRFAYLLDGMDLDKKAKGSRIWSPRKLLLQMERHYREHSANVVKKMDLEGWPADHK